MAMVAGSTLLETDEQRAEFMEMDSEQKAQLVYEQWKHDNFATLTPSDGACIGHQDLFDASFIPDREECDSRAEWKRAVARAETAMEQCKSVCAECPLMVQCLAATCMVKSATPGEFVAEEHGCFGGTDADERDEIKDHVMDLLGDDFYDGVVDIRGYSRTALFEDDLVDELGEAEFARQCAEERAAEAQKRNAFSDRNVDVMLLSR